MSAFGSSVINKSQKRFAPKAPVRRRPGAPSQESAPASARPSVERQTVSESPQPPTPQLAPIAQDVAIESLPVEQLPPGDNDVAQPALVGQTEEIAIATVAAPQVAPPSKASETAPQNLAPSEVRDASASISAERLQPAHVNNEYDDSGPAAKRRKIEVAAHGEETQVKRTAPVFDQAQRHQSESGDNSGGLSTSAETASHVETPATSTTEDVELATRLQALAEGDRASARPDASAEEQSQVEAAQDSSTPAARASTGPEEAKTPKKARKVRKDKGIPRKPKTSVATAEGQDDQAEEPEGMPAANEVRKRRKPETKRQYTATTDETAEGEIAFGDDAGKVVSQPRKKRKRAATPEGAENEELVPREVTMADLVKPSKRGKKSQREAAMANIDWVAARQQQRERALQRAENSRPAEASAANVDEALEQAGREREAANTRGPVLHTVNGQIVVDQSSLVVDRHAEAILEEDALETIEEDDLTRRVTTQSWVGDRRRFAEDKMTWAQVSQRKWSEYETDAFYDGLSMFGTDFKLIAAVVPGRTRRQIHNKFVREEKLDPERINDAIYGNRTAKSIDFAKYLKMSGRDESDYRDVNIFKEELAREEEKHKEEVEKAREEHEEEERQKKLAKERGDVSDSGEDVTGEVGKGKKKKKKRDRKSKKGKDKEPEKEKKKVEEDVEILGPIGAE